MDRVPSGAAAIADGGRDTNPARDGIEARGAAPNIPPGARRRRKPPFSPALRRGRNAVERMFGGLEDSRRTATRRDRLAQNHLAAAHIAAAVSYRL